MISHSNLIPREVKFRSSTNYKSRKAAGLEVLRFIDWPDCVVTTPPTPAHCHTEGPHRAGLLLPHLLIFTHLTFVINQPCTCVTCAPPRRTRHYSMTNGDCVLIPSEAVDPPWPSSLLRPSQILCCVVCPISISFLITISDICVERSWWCLIVCYLPAEANSHKSICNFPAPKYKQPLSPFLCCIFSTCVSSSVGVT